MPGIPQNQAINTINLLISLAQQMVSIYNQQAALDQYWTDNGNAVSAQGGARAILNAAN